MNPPKFVQVSFDVDKTLFREPALTRAARGLGIGKKWDAIDEMYQRKRITLRQALLQQFQLLVGMKLADVLAEVSKVPDRKSTRLNSSHANISYAVFCLKKKKTSKVKLTAHEQLAHADPLVTSEPTADSYLYNSL